MKVRVQLFGILGRKLPRYSAAEGVQIELPDKSSVRDLLEYLKIPSDWAPAAAMNSRLLKNDDIIKDGADIKIFQSVHGG
jgi:sulfur carrier protein ThiS